MFMFILHYSRALEEYASKLTAQPPFTLKMRSSLLTRSALNSSMRRIKTSPEFTFAKALTTSSKIMQSPFGL